MPNIRECMVTPIAAVVVATSRCCAETSAHAIANSAASSSVPLNYIGPIVTAVLLFFMAAACIGLWWNARNLRAFRTVGLYLLSVSSVFFIAFLREPLSWQSTLLILTSLLMPEMTADALGIRRGWWVWVNRIACALALLLAWSPLLPLLYRSTIDLSELFVLVLIVTGFRRGNARERLIAAALTVLWVTRAPLDPFVRRYIPMGFRIGGWRWNFGPIAMILFGAVAIAIFVRELIDDQREKQRLAAEFEAGRAMQQVLLGAELPSFSGLRIDSVYMPAGEVGGDFFQVLPAPDSGVLIAVGDVSGKGLRAAMTVSTILGALRALPVVPPAKLLHTLNRALIGRLQGGLVTCCMAHIAPGGTTTIANAGHLAPYLDGEELTLESGLPLGVTTDIDYPEFTFVLAPGDTLTFLSDGVVEAQSPSGELYGFERTRALSTRSAEQIAAAAQAFGQHDDITVLTLHYAPSEVLHA